jgi:hypothetical protein
VAVPYANFVVTETLWTGLVNQSGLAEEYRTEVVSDVAQLPEILNAAGC